MRRFRFRLQTLEKVRKTREDEALRELGVAQAGLQDAQSYRIRLERDRTASLVRREVLGQTQAIEAVAFQLESEFIFGQKQRIVAAEQAIFRARKGVERAMRGYLHARRQTRMIELIREKEQLNFKQAEAKREMKILDDLYVMRSNVETALGNVRRESIE